MLPTHCCRAILTERESERARARWDCSYYCCWLYEDDLEVQRYEPASIVVPGHSYNIFRYYFFGCSWQRDVAAAAAVAVAVAASTATGGCDCALIIKSKRISIVYPNSKRSCTLCGTCAARHRKKQQQQLHNNSYNCWPSWKWEAFNFNFNCKCCKRTF